MLNIGAQYGVHACLISAPVRFEERKYVSIDTQAHWQFAFGVVDLGLGPIEVKRRRIGITGDGAGDILIGQGIEFGPIGFARGQAFKVFSRNAHYAVGVRTE